MHHRMMNLPVSGTLGVAALLARLPIDLGVGPIPKSGRSWHLWQSEKARFSGLWATGRNEFTCRRGPP